MYRRPAYKKAPARNSKVKSLVTGNPNKTYLETLARGAGGVASLARAIAPVVAAINTEHKYFDSTAAGTAYNPGTNDALISLSSGIAQGTTDITRIGNSILMRDVQLKFYCDFAATAGIARHNTRMIMFIWKENIQDNPPTVAKILELPTNFYSSINRDYSDQLAVLHDSIYTHQAPYSAGMNAGPQFEKFYNKLDFHARFDGATAADATVNHVYLLIMGTSIVSTNASNYNLYSRINYTDN